MATINGNALDNTIIGTAGDDVLDGGLGDDILRGLAGNDRLMGRGGNDLLYGDAGNDLAQGGLGNDVIAGADGNDRLFGGGAEGAQGPDNDRIYGGNGNDQLHGGWGDDRLDGGNGDDILHGGFGADILMGGAGNDVLVAGTTEAGLGQSSTLIGGLGADIFRYAFDIDSGSSDDPESEFEAANDVIVDFRAGDKLDISGMFYNEADGDFFSHKVTFAELDTNGNGILTDADAGLSIARETYNGSTQFSLTIDFGQVSASIQEPGFVPSGTVTLFGVTTLQSSDFG